MTPFSKSGHIRMLIVFYGLTWPGHLFHLYFWWQKKVYLPLIQQFFMLSNAHTQVLKSILTAIKANVFAIYITGTYKIHYSYM